MNIEPIENYVLAGFLKRYQTVFFSCPVIWATSDDKITALKRVIGSSDLQYPYAFLYLESINYDTDAGLNASSLGRRGITITSNESSTLSQSIRLLSATFTVNCEFVTNDYLQAKEYAKLWLFAYRFGHLKFNLRYGRLKNVRCNVDLSESISLPSREDKTEVNSPYTITTSATIHGYVSKQLETKAMLHDVRVSSKPKAGQTTVWQQTWTIPPREK